MTNDESRMTKETPKPKAEVILLRPPGGAETETGGSPRPTETKPTAPAEQSAPPPAKAGKAAANTLPCSLARKPIW
jgi:hypothetical protein